jgi:hypothetical protein
MPVEDVLVEAAVVAAVVAAVGGEELHKAVQIFRCWEEAVVGLTIDCERILAGFNDFDVAIELVAAVTVV